MNPSGWLKILLLLCIISFSTITYMHNSVSKRKAGYASFSSNMRQIKESIAKARATLRGKSHLEYIEALRVVKTLMRDLTTLEEELKEANTATNARSLEVCPERRRGKIMRYIHIPKCDVMTKCSHGKPINKLVTIWINLKETFRDGKARLNMVLNGIADTYPGMKVKVAVASKRQWKAVEAAVNITSPLAIEWFYFPDLNQTEVWNQLKKKTTTIYAFVTRELLQFNCATKLEKMIETLSKTGAPAVGGASRDMNGYWRSSCYQTEMRGHTLKVQKGYRSSLLSCMKCHYLQGSFLVPTSSFHLDESLYPEEAFLDFFLNSTAKHYFSLLCPDVLIFERFSNLFEPKEAKYLSLARKWNLDTVILPQKETLTYSCSQVELPCSYELTLIGRSLPRCCLREIVRNLRILSQFFKNKGVSYVLAAGSMLTAMKLTMPAPYDVDADIVMDKTGYSILVKNQRWFRKRRGSDLGKCSKSGNELGSCKITYRGTYIDLWSKQNLSHFYNLPGQLSHQLSFVNTGGVWLPTFGNPGHTALNHFGLNLLKHAHSDLVPGIVDTKGKYKAGYFVPCLDDHHSCLDRFPVDGNLDFWPE